MPLLFDNLYARLCVFWKATKNVTAHGKTFVKMFKKKSILWNLWMTFGMQDIHKTYKANPYNVSKLRLLLGNILGKNNATCHFPPNSASALNMPDD